MKKRHTLNRYTMEDVATSIGKSIRTVERYLSKDKLDIRTMSLDKLVSFINKYSARRKELNLPSNPYQGRALSLP
jgi:AraC-like DNA-binding protein